MWSLTASVVFCCRQLRSAWQEWRRTSKDWDSVAAVAAGLGKQELGPAACCPACASVPPEPDVEETGKCATQHCLVVTMKSVITSTAMCACCQGTVKCTSFLRYQIYARVCHSGAPETQSLFIPHMGSMLLPCIPMHSLCTPLVCTLCLPLPGPRLHTDAISTAPCALRAAVLPCALQQHTAWALLKDDNGQPDEAAIQAAQQAGLLPGEVPTGVTLID